MKCPNCGASYAVKLPKCPYCGTGNIEGIKRNVEKGKRQLLFRRLRLKTIVEAGPVIVTKILTRIMIASVMLFIATMVIAFIIGYVQIQEEDSTANPGFSMSQHKEYLTTLVKNKEYMKLSDYLGDNNLSNKEFPEYWQLYEMYDALFRFRLQKDRILKQNTDKIKEDSFQVQYLLELGKDVLDFLNAKRYDELFPQNKDSYDQWHEEVYISLKIYFKLSDSEIKELIDMDYTKSNRYKKFVDIVIGRM